MKIETLFLTVLLTLAATRSYGQSVDGGDDDASDGTGALDAGSDASVDATSLDGGGSDASSTADAVPSDGAVAKDATSGGAQDGSNHLFARENPGCSLGGVPDSGGWQLVAGIFIAAAARRRRSSRTG